MVRKTEFGPPLRFAQKLFRSLPAWLRYSLWGRWQNPPRHEYISRREDRRILAALSRIFNSNPEGSICFLPTQTWFCSGFQRPQQMARAFADLGYAVVFVEPWDCADVWLTDETTKQRRFRGLRHLSGNLWLLRYPAEKLNGLLRRAAPSAIVMSWPDQDTFVRQLDRSEVIYEMIDDHSLMPQADAQWHAIHQRWLRKAAVVAASADDLLEQVRTVRPDALLVPNAVRLEDWETKGLDTCPQDLVAARRNRIVVGYYGAIAEWFDWELWNKAACLRPDWSFVLIGYSYDGNNEKVSMRIKDLPNAFFLGGKPYHELPRYLAQFDVATIPFLLNTITHGCSPVKLFEYMAAGKPIVCTPMREILKYRSIYFANSAEEFVAQIERAESHKDDQAYQHLLREEAEANTWRTRVQMIRSALNRNGSNAPRSGQIALAQAHETAGV